jgi:hypothetical protein
MRFHWLKTRFLSIDISQDKKKNGEIFMFPSLVLSVSGCQPSLVLLK